MRALPGSASVLLIVLGVALPAGAKGPAPCADGRFLVPEGTALVGTPPGTRDAVTLAARQLGIDSGCAARRATVKAGRQGTRIGAKWPSCGERRKVRLKGVIAAPACDTLQGSVRAKGAPKVAFTAVRSVCGDGYADAAGGETCDGQGSDGSEPTLAVLEAARAELAGGADDVALSPDGTLRFRRSTAGSVTIEEIVREGATLAQWVHSGDSTTASADGEGDGSNGTVITAERAPVRRATVATDHDGDGSPERTTTLTQSGATDVQVQIAGTAPDSFTTTLLQEMRPITPAASRTCTPADISTARTALAGATSTGLACLRGLGLGDWANLIAGKIARDGIEFACDDSNNCAQVDILDGVTRGLLPTSLGINIGAGFAAGAGACANREMVMFHELLHIATGDGHSPFLDRTTFEGLATDRVYSCTDLCYRPGQATKCECATCFGVDRCDPKCAGFLDCPDVGGCDVAVAMTQTSCPPTACQCCPSGGFCSGTFWIHRMEGTASGPVGAVLRVNFTPSLGGELQCPGWTPTPCPPSATNLACCTRTSAQQPQQTTFVATLPAVPPFAPLQCICPPPSPTSVGFVAQVGRTDAGANVEEVRSVSCPQ